MCNWRRLRLAVGDQEQGTIVGVRSLSGTPIKGSFCYRAAPNSPPNPHRLESQSGSCGIVAAGHDHHRWDLGAREPARAGRIGWLSHGPVIVLAKPPEWPDSVLGRETCSTAPIGGWSRDHRSRRP